MATQCKSKTRAGGRCSAYATQDGFCFTHSPSHAKERAQAHKRGGRHRAVPKVGVWSGRVVTIADALNFINDLVIPDLVALENTVPRARALIASAEAAVRAITDGELEQRISQLESLAEVKP